MRLDFQISRFDWAASPAAIGPGVRDIAQRAEALGVGTLLFLDHYFQREVVAPAEDPMLEGYTSLGFVAGFTDRMHLRLLATGVTYRHPGLLAKIVTTLDVLSGGRAELGIGAGWYERDPHGGLGVPLPPVAERYERLEEALQICLQMWSDNEGPYVGRHYRLQETMCRPAPISSPRPRILIAGNGERKTIPLVAKYADACNFFCEAEEVAHKIEVLRRHCDALGRDSNEIEITVVARNLPSEPAPEEMLRRAEAFAGAGVSTFIASTVDHDPAGWLQATFEPIMDRIREIEPKGF